MHNPLIVISVATYVTLVQIGMAAVAMLMPKLSVQNDVRKRRIVAGTIAYLVGMAAAAAYAFFMRDQITVRATHIATVLILLFGLSIGIYNAVPKIVPTDPTAEDQMVRQKWHNAAAAVGGIALLGSVAAAGVAWHMMKVN